MLLMPVTSGGSRIQLRSTTTPPKHAASADFHIFYTENSKLLELATEIEI